MKGKRYYRDEEYTRKINKMWDRRVRTFYKLAAKIISTKTLTLAEVRSLVRTYTTFAHQWVYPSDLTKKTRRELNVLIRKKYY